jgi:hypothetical protein
MDQREKIIVKGSSTIEPELNWLCYICPPTSFAGDAGSTRSVREVLQRSLYVGQPVWKDAEEKRIGSEAP